MPESIAQAIAREISRMQDGGLRTAWLSEQNRQAMAAAEQGAASLARPRQAAMPQPSAPQSPVAPQAAFAPPPRPASPQSPAAPPQPVFTPPAPVIPRDATWEMLESTFQGCRCCPSRVRHWEYGCRAARVMFIGDHPRSAGPLPSTPAGLMLMKMATAMKLHWENPPSPAFAAYATDVLKCLPPARPAREQLAACLPFLERQIELVRPDALVLLGQLPTSILTGKREPFLQLRGSWQTYNGIPAVVIQHPAMILRFQGQPELFLAERRLAWNTLQELMKFLQIQ